MDKFLYILLPASADLEAIYTKFSAILCYCILLIYMYRDSKYIICQNNIILCSIFNILVKCIIVIETKHKLCYGTKAPKLALLKIKLWNWLRTSIHTDFKHQIYSWPFNLTSKSTGQFLNHLFDKLYIMQLMHYSTKLKAPSLSLACVIILKAKSCT